MAPGDDRPQNDYPERTERVRILVPLPVDAPYTYAAPVGIRAGEVVAVPFGRRTVAGVVWPVDAAPAPEAAGPGQTQVKPILHRHDLPPLPLDVLRFVAWVADYTMTPVGAVLRMVLSVPAALDPRPAAVGYRTAAATPPGLRLTEARNRVLGIARHAVLARAELSRRAGVGSSVVSGLIAAGALDAVDMAPEASAPAPDPDRIGPELSAEQAVAAAALRDKVAGGGYCTIVLDGVPGAGKTEVYFEAVAEALQRGRNVLVLLPEIALSSQWLGRFAARFGAQPLEWHSDLTPAQRRSGWREIALGRARVVVGARSALMLPHRDLGLIVIDEEHDAAYKQEDGVIYNARDMAVVRARMADVPLILASATPSLETVTNVEAGRYERLHLPARHGGAAPPEVTLIDMRRHPPPRGRWLSEPLVEAVRQTVEAGQQALLYLNRRGYAPLTLCRKCGHRMQCPRCTAWLVEHRGNREGAGRLACHHCGYNVRAPKSCPSCGAEDSLVPCGPGVERLAEEVAQLFPDARRAIAASDTLPGPKAAAELIRRIENHDIDIVIGTQIVAKGYHFPLLTLVGAVDADLGLAGGDLRAAERTYQTLYQVAGRAGRTADLAGRAVLQTHMPENPVMQALAAGDRDRFLRAESQARRQGAMPPFGRLAALIVSGDDEAAVDEAARALGRAAPRDVKGVTILGPAPAPMAILRGRHRRRLLFKAARGTPVQTLIARWLETACVQRNIRVQIDIDPYSFL